ncbi:MAG TPA: tetratricopeptide repeat protein [Chthonomonadales bacterium]|nr:tetratricopeptide repeat protein [Chthonomonadales bacterium]
MLRDGLPQSGSLAGDPSLAQRAEQQRGHGGSRLRLQLSVFALAILVPAALFAWWLRMDGMRTASAREDPRIRATLHPEDIGAVIAWGSELVQQGRLEDAGRLFAQAAQTDPHDARPFALLGALALKQGKPAYARVNFEQAARDNPSDPDVWDALGNLYANSSLRSKAPAAFERVVSLRPGDVTAWRKLGLLLEEGGHYTAGRKALEKALSLAPADGDIQDDLARNDLLLGSERQAEQLYATVLATRPQDPVALVGSAEAMLRRKVSAADLALAQRRVEMALQRLDSGHSHLILGRILLARKLYPQSVAELKKALQRNPGEPNPYAFLARAYQAMGNTAQAQQEAASYRNALTKLSLGESKQPASNSAAANATRPR